MKKLTVTLIALLLAAACTAPPTNREATTTTNANMSTAPKTAAPFTEAEASAKEKQVWETLQKKDYDAFTKMLDADLVNVAPEAAYDKAATIKAVNGFVPMDPVFTDWKLVSLDKDAAVLLYKVKFKGSMNGQSFPEATVYAASAWVNRNGQWLAIYHQETEPMTGPPPPAPAKSAKPAASPVASQSPLVTSSDVTANEKAVWDALKAKNFGAFETILASDFMEIEPNGIMTKAESLKTMPDFDLSKATLSDWKVVKFDNDASLITYVVKIPNAKPDTERHTTIWANKDGKWSAVFHQGTPVKPPEATPSPKAASPSPKTSAAK